MAQANILHPFQRAAFLPRDQGKGQFLLLAAREHLYQIDVAERRQVASWEAKSGAKQTAITLLAASPDSSFVAAVTGDDKTVHILDTANGLTLIRSIALPKRPCALSFTSSGEHLLCGDKFGDVYALPVNEDTESEPVRKRARKAKTSTPAATNLTVHTKGNLQALEYQRKLTEKAAKEGKAPERPSNDVDFPYEPIIGHVSMLTDIAAARVVVNDAQAESAQHKTRDFIITADRDEHIRVSRGLPQSHVIHGFCLGHQQFVNKLCLLKSGFLVSGGGDDYLCIWDWQQSIVLAKVDLAKHILRKDVEGASSKIAVIGLWDCSTDTAATNFICVCEGYPQLLHVRSFDQAGVTSKRNTVLPLRGNPLDAAFLPSSAGFPAMIIVCLDNVHEAESMGSARDSENLGPRLQVFEVAEEDGSLLDIGPEHEWPRDLDAQCTPQATVENAQILTSQLSSLLYGVENLRKRGGGEEAEV